MNEPTEVIVLAIAENCPHLSDLSVHLMHELKKLYASLSVLKALRGLPLRRLDFHSVTYPAELG